MAIPRVASFADVPSLRSRLAESSGTLLLLAICLLPVLLYLPFLTEPFDRDEGAYATIAQAVLRGELPYRDYFDHKPPLIYGWFAASFQLFGETVVAPRLMAALVWSATALVVFAEANLLFTRRTAYWAAGIFAASSGLAMLQASANTEAFMLLPLTASLYAATRAFKDDSWRWFLAAGALGAAATLTKQVAIVNLAALGSLCVASAIARHDIRRGVVMTAALTGGAVGVVGLCLLPFALTHSLGDFYYANLTYNHLYSSETSIGQRLNFEINGAYFFGIAAAPLLVGTSVSTVLLARRHLSLLALLPLGWVLATQAGAMLSGRAFPHYYVALLPPMALMTGWFVSHFAETERLRLPIFSALVLSLIVCVLFNAPAYTASTPNQKHLARFPDWYAAPQIVSMAVAERVAQLTTPDQPVYNFGRETQVYFYAHRKPAIRFMYDRPFSLDPSTFNEAMADLERAPPALIFDSVSERSDPDWEANHPQALREFLAAHYAFVQRVEFADIYLLQAQP